MRLFTIVAAAFICALIARALVVEAGSDLVRHEESRVSMACTYTIVLYGRDRERLRRIASEALDEVDRIDRLMSHYRAESPLSRLNREGAGGPVAVDPELYDFIDACMRYSRSSAGAFDITVGPLMKAWGFFRGEGRRPSRAELEAARAVVGYRHLILDARARTIAFDRKGVELDLGGIAKGYAVDRAVEILKSHGITSALLSSGGSTIYALGAPPGRKGWEVEVRDPADPRRTAFEVSLKDRALSVSGGDEKFFEVDGVRYSHILDPRTGRPVQGVLLVVVEAASGLEGDALDNVFYVQGVEASRAALKDHRGVKVHFFLPAAGKPWRLISLGG
jgi:thiamine biosynthesis lipoprotein